MLAAEKKKLRSRAHSLRPVVITGQSGISDGVLAEIDNALDHHELIKVRVRCDDREERKRMIDEIRTRSGAELIQRIGQIAVLYRKNPEKH